MRTARLLSLMIAVGTVGAVACAAPAGPTLSVAASPALDVATPIAADGLTPGETVRLRTSMPDRTGMRWSSEAVLRADGAGRVDTARTASTAGSYRGVDVAGPYWSMRPERDVPAPYPLVRTPVLDVDVDLVRGDSVAAHTVLHRGSPVGTRPVADGGLVGDLYLPAAPGPHPGVLLLGGSDGGRPDPTFAALLAARGFVVFGLAYFGEPGLPPRLDRIPVEYGLAGADWLASRPEVGGGRIGLHGTSKGAEYALLLAASAPQRFAAVTAVVGSDVVWPALAFGPGPSHSSWTRAGRDVPFVPPRIGPAPAFGPPGAALRVAGSYRGWWDGATPAERAAARIPVERIGAPVLLVSAGDDGIWPSQAQSDRVEAALRSGGNADVRYLRNPATGHFVGGVPHLPSTVTRVASGPVALETGGEPAATERARRSSWDATLALFDRALK